MCYYGHTFLFTGTIREPYMKWEDGCDHCQCINNTVKCSKECPTVICQEVNVV